MTGGGFTHGAVKHGKKEYAHYDYRSGETFHVNTVEGFWRLFKASIRSTHVQISAKHMQNYLSGFTFRASNRERVNGMFDRLVGGAVMRPTVTATAAPVLRPGFPIR